MIESYVLIANDDPYNLTIMTMLVESVREELRKNFKIIKATDGQQAVDLFEKTTNIKLILMDVCMPLKDGYEATREIRSIEQSRSNQLITFIVGVSGYTGAAHLRQCQQVGMDEAITDQLTTEKLKILISKVF